MKKEVIEEKIVQVEDTVPKEEDPVEDHVEVIEEPIIEV